MSNFLLVEYTARIPKSGLALAGIWAYVIPNRIGKTLTHKLVHHHVLNYLQETLIEVVAFFFTSLTPKLGCFWEKWQ